MTSPYEKALQLGYTDEQIAEHLSKKDPAFSAKYKKALDLGYKPQDIFSKYNQSKTTKPIEEKTDIKEYAKEVGQQAAKGFTIGSIGTYGDILDMFGLQPKETLPGEKARYQLEAEATPEELPGLVESEDIVPRYSKLPSGKETEKFLGMMGLAPEAKTAAGRYGERAGKLAGSFLATGTPALKAPLIAGAAGQTLEELGAPPWLQAAGEIITTLKTMPKGKVEISSRSPEVQNTISRLKKLGFNDEDITLAKNALEERGLLKTISKVTSDVGKKFESTIKSTEENFNKILEGSFPGITKEGPQAFKNASSKLFDSLEQKAKQTPIKYTGSFAGELNNLVKNLKKTLAETPQEKQVINYLESAIEESRPKFKGGRAAIAEQPSGLVDQFGKPIMKAEKPSIPAKKQPPLTADYYLRFYKGLNAIGRWDNPKQREHVFTLTKNSIKNVLKKQGLEGAELASDLEKANKSWIKYLQAEDVSSLVNKSMTEEGINFSKLSKSLENKSNFDTLVEGLGKEQASNLKFIADTGKNIKNFDKLLTGDQAKKIFGSIKIWETAKALMTLDFPKLGALIGHQLAGKFASKMLTEPKYQNILMKMVQAAKDSKWNQVAILSRNLENLNKPEEKSPKNRQ